MTPPIILIGLDAAEAGALAAGPDDARFPTLAGLMRSGAHGRLIGHHDCLTDTVWPEIRTGTSGVHTGVYYAPLQFRSGERRPRPLTAEELSPDRFYWNVAADAGCRVAVIDQPLVASRDHGSAAEITGWGTHDRPFGLECHDPRLAPILDRLGPHPISECNRINDGSEESRVRLLSLIHLGIDRHAAAIEAALAADSWDLFSAVFSESHCVGHHYWPPLAGVPGDRSRGEPGTRVIEEVYRHLDTAVGRILAAAPAGATVIVYTSHGMGPTDEGAFVVGDVLERLGMVPSNRGRRRMAALVPERFRGVIRRIVGGAVLQRAGLTADRAFGDPATRAVPLPNSRHGAIRLAVAGRDPAGVLRPGSAEYRGVVDEIRTAFMELTLVPTGERIVEEVIVTDDRFGVDRHPDLPDLIIQFRTDLGMLRSVTSERIGTIHLIRHSHRTGEHGTPGAVWMQGAGIAPGSSLGDVETVDLAPTVLAGLGQAVPDWIDGRPITA